MTTWLNVCFCDAGRFLIELGKTLCLILQGPWKQESEIDFNLCININPSLIPSYIANSQMQDHFKRAQLSLNVWTSSSIPKNYVIK